MPFAYLQKNLTVAADMHLRARAVCVQQLLLPALVCCAAPGAGPALHCIMHSEQGLHCTMQGGLVQLTVRLSAACGLVLCRCTCVEPADLQRQAQACGRISSTALSCRALLFVG